MRTHECMIKPWSCHVLTRDPVPWSNTTLQSVNTSFRMRMKTINTCLLKAADIKYLVSLERSTTISIFRIIEPTHTQCSLNTHCTLHSVHCTLYITHYYWQWIFARYNVKSTTFIDNINWYILQLIWSLRGFETSNSQAAVYTKDLGKMHINFSYTQHTHTNSWTCMIKRWSCHVLTRDPVPRSNTTLQSVNT